jgi:hypothetical protein
MWEWFERTETATGYPNAFRICKVSRNLISHPLNLQLAEKFPLLHLPHDFITNRSNEHTKLIKQIYSRDASRLISALTSDSDKIGQSAATFAI